VPGPAGAGPQDEAAAAGSTPIVEIVPATEKIDRLEWIGSMKDSVDILGDIISPATDEDDWEVLRD